MEVSGQLHAPAGLLPGKEPSAPKELDSNRPEITSLPTQIPEQSLKLHAYFCLILPPVQSEHRKLIAIHITYLDAVFPQPRKHKKS
jgi:hypothetical protein